MNICLAHGGDISDPSGGTDRVTALATGLARNDATVTLVVPEPRGRVTTPLDGVEVRPIPTGPVRSNSLVRAERITRHARSIANDRGAMLQLEHSTLAGVGTLRGCNGYVLDMHDLAFPRFDHVDNRMAPLLKRSIAWLERRAVKRATHVIVVSDVMRELLHRKWGIARADISVVPNGYYPDRVDAVRDLSPVEGRVCFLGTLHPKVDVDAFAAIAELPDVTEMVVIGDGAQRGRVESVAQTHPAVRSLGRLPDEEAFELLATAEVVVNPQTSSALQRSSSPVKLFYYAAMGKPMVVSEGPAIVDRLTTANAARSANDRDDFVEHVQSLMASPTDRATLSWNAQSVARQFTWERRADAVCAVYDRQLSPHET